ncbi:MAG: phosphohistidine phosphatase [Blastocatellia bacterium]|jgi:phosphohistidine phosphatase|nr:phosphohistidine phosphatase [Blastocatellia bacterium]
MKTLLLLRHAKSSWKEPQQRDFDRPLNKRGLKAARLMGRFLRKQKIQPDLLLSSPAERARQTSSLVIESAGLVAELRYDERIYEASASSLLEIISQIEARANSVLLIGHNPGFEELLLMLTGDVQHMPTAAFACITLDIERWTKVREKTGSLAWLVKPKELV